MSDKKLTQFKAILFDCYGTIIDWETSIFAALQPLSTRLESPLISSKADALIAFQSVERDLQAKYPDLPYSDLLALGHAELAARLQGEPSAIASSSAPVAISAHTTSGTMNAGSTATQSSQQAKNPQIPAEREHLAFGQSIGSWAPFPDSIAALHQLSKDYKLFILSNVDRASFAKTRTVLETSEPDHAFQFAAVYTAQDIGSYKPNVANFEYALKKMEKDEGIKKEEVLVVACSLYHDHVPANQLGLANVWIAREGAVMGVEADSKYLWKFATLGDLVKEVQRQFGEPRM